MPRIGFALLALVLLGCGNKGSDETTESNDFSYAAFEKRFRSVTPPYQLADTALQNVSDTTTIMYPELTAMLDSARQQYFGNEKVQYTPLAHLKGGRGEAYFVVRAGSRSKKAAYLLVYNKDKFSAVLPFLLPDNDPNTQQVSSIDRSFGITRTVAKKDPEGVMVDGKEVFAYSVNDNAFSLVLMDMFDNAGVELINPIDTLAQTHKFAGDYYLDKNNLVSVRDGRDENVLNVFIHIVKNGGACTGELKGEVLLKDNTAAFRQSGNPCVVELKFSGRTVKLKEQSGCGSSRGLDCVFDGTYTKKKAEKGKTSAKEK